MRKTSHILSRSLVGKDQRISWSSVHYACLDCRVSFKKPRTDLSREAETAVFPCPNCGSPLQYMGRSFKAPRRTAVVQWRKLALLIQHGYRFESQWATNPLPKSMRELNELLNNEKPTRNMTRRRWETLKREQASKEVGRARRKHGSKQ